MRATCHRSKEVARREDAHEVAGVDDERRSDIELGHLLGSFPDRVPRLDGDEIGTHQDSDGKNGCTLSVHGFLSSEAVVVSGWPAHAAAPSVKLRLAASGYY
jgi:hypothetical protein